MSQDEERNMQEIQETRITTNEEMQQILTQMVENGQFSTAIKTIQERNQIDNYTEYLHKSIQSMEYHIQDIIHENLLTFLASVKGIENVKVETSTLSDTIVQQNHTVQSSGNNVVSKAHKYREALLVCNYL